MKENSSTQSESTESFRDVQLAPLTGLTEVKSDQIMEMVESEQFGNESKSSADSSSSESEDEKEGRPESEEYQKLNESSSSADLLEDAPKSAVSQPEEIIEEVKENVEEVRVEEPVHEETVVRAEASEDVIEDVKEVSPETPETINTWLGNNFLYEDWILLNKRTHFCTPPAIS